MPPSRRNPDASSAVILLRRYNCRQCVLECGDAGDSHDTLFGDRPIRYRTGAEKIAVVRTPVTA